MDNLLELSQFIIKYATAVETGLGKFMQASPVFAKQHITRLANRKLNSTKDQYLDAVTIKLRNNVLVIELDKDSWIANAVEEGASPFDMKATHLKSPKAKISKDGYRYMVIPIGKQKDGPGGKTEKSQDIQKRINKALADKKFGITNLKSNIRGQVVETQQVISDDLSGLYRYRTYDTAEQFFSNSKPQWQHVMFRIMSENPMSQGKWMHPGIQPAHIFRETERFLIQNIPNMVEGFIESEIEKLLRGK